MSDPGEIVHAAATALPSATTSMAGFTCDLSVNPLCRGFPYFDFGAVFSTFVTCKLNFTPAY